MKTKEWTCAICGSATKTDYVFREMMFGFRDEFEYAECEECGCIQIRNEPENIKKYYPPYYYSFNREISTLKRKPFIKRLVKDYRIKRVYNRIQYPDLLLLKEAGVKASDKILDIGCGNGELICRLFNQGFEYVRGTDKFISNDINYGFGVKIHKAGLTEIPSSSYNFLMMHHVLEHIPNQLEELKECYRILKPKSFLLVRIPVKNRAWEIYKEDWVQLDAPRHYFIHTVKSIDTLAKETGFEIRKTIFDSSAFQFLVSEQYKKDISMYVTETYLPYPSSKLFSDEEIIHFEERAKQLNKEQQGDQAAFYLYKN